ncbi:hypothetical protein AHAT_32380 [Agarivorans sp. Toyoura001]|uniref:AbiTii domain-containing protein n=1 Tax=Agarivorans sp. Toyoura001 TaxID=2283141 RepID=UPI0010F35845|nr:hypothetical protein [Agarivorans sp. Toyoura001]GDY27348.1 hypothetical protein AHAT_32380 [Agarivorans sp. Toyoura001]
MSTTLSSPQLIKTLDALLLEAQQHASSLEHEDLELWLEHELNGYGDFAHFPDYRIVECKQLGIFVKPQQELQHFEQIHDDCLNERDRCRLRYLHIQEPLLECLNKQDEIQRPWPLRILASYANDIIPGYSCVRAWQSYHEPLNDRFIHGVLGHLLHLLLEEPVANTPKILKQLGTLCQQDSALFEIWQKLYCETSSAV